MTVKVLIFAADVIAADDRPASGGGIRALQLKTILEKHGFDVVVSSPIHSFIGKQVRPNLPSEITETSYSIRPQQEIYKAVSPDVVIFASAWTSVQGSWWPDCPVVVDCCGPIYLEALLIQDKTTLKDRLGLLQRKIAVLAGADYVLLGSRRQQYYFRESLAAAGFSLTQQISTTSCVLPMGANPAWIKDPESLQPIDPVSFVYAGGLYPWQNPLPAIEKILSVLETQNSGEFVWIGGSHAINNTDIGLENAILARLRQSNRTKLLPYLTIRELNEQLSQSSHSLELMAPNFERDLAMTTRTPHYMGLGLIPIVESNMEVCDWTDFKGCSMTFSYEQLQASGSSFDSAIESLFSEQSKDKLIVKRKRAITWVQEHLSWSVQGQSFVEFCQSPVIRPNKETLSSRPPEMPLTRGEQWLIDQSRRPLSQWLRKFTRPLFHGWSSKE